MLPRLVGAAVRQRRVLTVAVVVVLATAAFVLPDATYDAVPEFGDPTVEVQTEALGLSAAEVEQLVTGPIERMLLDGLPFLKDVRSRSVPSLSAIDLIFEPGTSLFTARQLVQERLTISYELPNVSKPPHMLQSTSATNRLMMVGLTSSTRSLIDMSTAAKFDLRPRLLGVPGVAAVSVWGENDLQLQVQVDPNKLREKNVTLDQVISSTGNGVFTSPLTYLQASTPGNGGFIETQNQRMAVQHVLPVQSPADLAQFAIEDHSDVRLGDIGTVVEDHQPLVGSAGVGGKPGLVLVIEKLPGANTVEVTKAVNDTLDAVAPGLPGIDMDRSLYRPATFVQQARHHLTQTGTVAAIALLLALAVLMFDPRRLLVCLLAVPLPVVAGAWVLYLTGQTFDSMTFTGLIAASALAVVDAVLLSEVGLRAVRTRGTQPTRPALADALGELSPVIVYANLIAAVALIPAMFLANLPERPFLSRMAWPFGLALASCLVTSLLVTPALVALVPGTGTTRAPIGERALAKAHRVVFRPLHVRPVALGVVGALLAAGGMAMAHIHSELHPRYVETDLVASFTARPGTALPEIARILDRAAAELRTVPGVRDVGSLPGRAVGSDQVVGSASGELWINLDPDADHARTVAAVQRVVDGYPGIAHQVNEYFNDRVARAAATQRTPVLVRLFGDDIDVMNGKADEIRTMLSGVPGVVAPQVEHQATEPTIEVAVDLAAADRAGVKPGDIRRAAATLIQGLTVGNLYQDQKVFEVVVVGDPAIKHDLTSVQNALIDTATGGHVRLGDVASIKIARGYSAITHEETSKVLDITAGISGPPRSEVLNDIRQRLAVIPLPLAYRAQVIDADSKIHTAHRKVAGAAAAALVLVYLLLQAATDSWLLALLGLLAVPAALGGGLVAIWISGDDFSLGSIAGLVVVGALCVRITLPGLTTLRRPDPEPDPRERGLRAFEHYAVPGLQALGAVAVMTLPFVFMNDVPGSEFLHPAAIAVLGGTLATVLVGLIAVPGLAVPPRVRVPAAPPEPVPAWAGVTSVPPAAAIGSGPPWSDEPDLLHVEAAESHHDSDGGTHVD